MATKTPSKVFNEIKQNPYFAYGEDSIYKISSKMGGRKKLIPSGTIENISVVSLRNQMVVPFQNTLIDVTDDEEKLVIKRAHDSQEVIVISPATPISSYEKNNDNSDNSGERRGVLAVIDEYQIGHDGVCHVLLSTSRSGVIKDSEYIPFEIATFEIDNTSKIDKISADEAAISDFIEELYANATQYLDEDARTSLYDKLNESSRDSERRFFTMVQNSPLDENASERILSINNYAEKRFAFIVELQKGLKLMELRREFHNSTMAEISQRQKEEYVRNQIRVLQNELGEGEDSEVRILVEKASKKEWSEETAKSFTTELRKLQRYAPNSPDYAVQYSYLETMLELPWNHCDNSNFEIEDVAKILDRDHFGLDKVKERIVEHTAVLKLRNDMKAPILCLYGPPGVGKTSLGKSVAEAMGRKYVRLALGGVHDEAEIRGHRRTYLGSMPGRIITALKKCGTSDPVMVLDEIDKLGADIKGDPSSALLEVLDPEQNCKFHDNYINYDYDLSKILFIATANDLSTISAPLRDRMELIEIGGYVEDEKIEIAKRFLVPKNLELHGFEKDEISFTTDALHEIIEYYTRESGVRRLEKKIATIIRKQACLKASHKEFPAVIDAKNVRECLGKQEVFPDSYESNDIPGVVTGLAWTAAGGEILFIESSVSEGKESKITLTGNLGDVMKESAVIALQYLRSNSSKFGLDKDALDKWNVHIHVPEGAIPKDGPSAGITMATSLASAFSKRKVRAQMAMTGEITLRGKVLPVGGIKEKILAAKRAGIKDIVLSVKNRKDIEDIKPEYIEGLNFHFVDNVAEVLDFALLDERCE